MKKQLILKINQNFKIYKKFKMSKTSLVRPGLTTSFKKNLPSIKHRLRSKVTTLSKNDVRKAEMPYYQAIVLELFESGYQSSAIFLNNLIKYEQSLNLPKELLIKKLVNSNDIIDKLAENAKIIEKENLYGTKLNVIQLYYVLAVELIDLNRDLYWLTEQIFLLTIDESVKYTEDEGLLETRIRHQLGIFYADKMKKYDKASEQLGIAKKLCKGHEKTWQMSETNFQLLSTEVCSKHCEALKNAAVLFSKTDPAKAAEFAKISIEVAIEADIPYAISDCYLEYGKIINSMKKYDEALESFTKSFKFAQISGQVRKICESYLQLAIVNNNLNQSHISEKYLKSIKKIADRNNLYEYLAKYHELQGAIYLSRGFGVEAAEQLVHTVNIYNKLGLLKQLRHARCLASIAMGQEIMTPFIETLKKSDKEKFGNNKYTAKLLRWQSTRQPFWEYLKQKIVVSTTDTTLVYDESEAMDVKMKPKYDFDIYEDDDKEITVYGVYLNGIVNQIKEIKLRTNFDLIEETGFDKKRKSSMLSERRSY